MWNETKLSGAVDMTEEKDTIQRNVDNFEEWSHVNLMRFNKSKCKVYDLVGAIPRSNTNWGMNGLKARKGLGILADENLCKSEQCAFAAEKSSRILECIKSSMANRSWEVKLPLYSAVLRPDMEH